MTIIEKLKEQIEIANRKELKFLLVGRTGVGKSSTINSLFNKEMAAVGDYEATTLSVENYRTTMEGIPVQVFDTPGLCDDVEELGNDEHYLKLMREHVQTIDSMWFVSRLDETRVSSDERRGIRQITQALGEGIWKHAVIVFTFAGNVSKERYHEALEKRSALIRKEIAKHTSKNIAEAIPGVAVDNMKKTTPDDREWLGELFTEVFSQISNNAALTFLLAMKNNILPDQKGSTYINVNEEQRKRVQKKIDAAVIPSLTALGAGIGSAFGPVGTAIGGAVGAVVGVISWFWG